jgi:hypothetical protein
LKRGYYVLIGGAALLVAGVAITIIWALPIAEQFQREATALQGAPLESGQSRNLSLAVTDASKPISIIVNSRDRGVPLEAILITPDGKTPINSTFTENTVLGANPEVPGTYKLTVSNKGQAPTSIDVIFGRLPGVEQNKVDFGTFGGVVAGAGVIIAGIIVMIAGVAIILFDRRRV